MAGTLPKGHVGWQRVPWPWVTETRTESPPTLAWAAPSTVGFGYSR